MNNTILINLILAVRTVTGVRGVFEMDGPTSCLRMHGIKRFLKEGITLEFAVKDLMAIAHFGKSLK